MDLSAFEALMDRGPTPETRVLEAEREAALRSLLQCLPERLRAPVVLRDMEELSYEEIAATLGCDIGTVSSRLNRGRKLLARKARRGIA